MGLTIKSILLLVLLSGCSVWHDVPAQTPDEPKLFVDPNRLSNSRIWILMNYNKPALSGSLSTKIQLTFDCPQALRQITAYMTYSERMGRGTVLYIESPEQLAKEPWIPVRPNTNASKVMELVCAPGASL